MAVKTGRCLSKNVVYRISCLHCDLVYIGETGRTIGSRVKEHLKMREQTVYILYSNKLHSPIISSPQKGLKKYARGWGGGEGGT